MYLAMMQDYTVFYNGKSKSGTTSFFGMALVHPIESFKNPVYLILVTTTFFPCRVLPAQTLTLPPGLLYLIAFSVIL